MQTRLTIEEHDTADRSVQHALELIEQRDSLVVFEMTLNNVANAQLVCHVVLVAKLEILLDVLLTALQNEVGSRMNVGTIPDSLAQRLDIVGRDTVREREDFGDALWHSDLVDLQIRVGRDDGSSREIDSLARQVATETTLLSLETLTEAT